jgi:hypothetical protein
MMSIALMPPRPGGSGTKGTKPFSMATWNICCRRGTGMAAAAKGLAQMEVRIGILTKMKVTDNRYSKSLLGYKVIVFKTVSPHQGGIGLVWREDHNGFEVKAIRPTTLNLLTFQLVMGDKRFYLMGIYIPPNYTTGVEDLRVAWEACPVDCTPLVIGDLNIRFEDPADNRADAIVNC